MSESNVGKWDRWYQGVTVDEPQLYGDDTTYRIGAQWLRGSDLIFDLGCGKGGFKHVWETVAEEESWPLLDRCVVMGVDGSKTPFADITADLTEYRVNLSGFAEGFKVSVFMRHVIEHNADWRTVLANAVASFNHRMCLVLFTPVQMMRTQQIAWNDDPGVPDIGFNLNDLAQVFAEGGIERNIEVSMHETNTQYGVETVLRATREAGGGTPG